MIKLRKLTLLCTAIFISLFATCQTSSAQSGWCSQVKVLSAGSKTTGPVVYMENTRSDCGTWPQNTKRWFYLDNTDNNANGMLAAAMTAMAMDTSITVVPKGDESYLNWSSLIMVTVNPE